MQFVLLFAMSLAVVAGMAVHHREAADAEPVAAPRVGAIAVAPTEIRLTVELADYSTELSATGGPEGEQTRSWYVSARPELHDGRWLTRGGAVLSARPGTKYRLRARARVSRGSVSRTRESDECVVKTPPEPRERPTTPFGINVAAPSPFALEVQWEFDGVHAYGFEIQRRDDAGEFRRVGVVEPDARRFVDHGRRPNTASIYRVRAFNPRGVSTWSVPASGTTRPLAKLSAPPHKELHAACTTLDAETTRLAEEASFDGAHAETRVCRGIALDGHHRVDAVTVPVLCGAQNCGWTLYAELDGCYRALGSFTLEAPECPRFETVAAAANGWPVLRAYAHESGSSASVAVQVFLHGEYVEVDHYVECASAIPVVRTADGAMPERSDDPTRWAPPFVGCW